MKEQNATSFNSYSAFRMKRVEIKLLVLLAEEVIRITVHMQLTIDFLNWKDLLANVNDRM